MHTEARPELSDARWLVRGLTKRIVDLAQFVALRFGESGRPTKGSNDTARRFDEMPLGGAREDEVDQLSWRGESRTYPLERDAGLQRTCTMRFVDEPNEIVVVTVYVYYF